MTAWTEQGISSLRVKRAVVNGRTSGIGRATATGLAAHGAEAMQAITEHAPGASVCFEALDLACLASVASFAARISAWHDALDILVNDAGVMALPQRGTTADGFETQLGVNYLGHFALTSLLLPLLRSVQVPRVVSVTSLSHRMGRIDFDDLQAERGYAPWKAYSQSKLALLIFALELQRRSDMARWGLTSLAAHPGWALTNFYSNGPALEGTPPFLMRLMRLGTRFFSHSDRPVLRRGPACCGLRAGTRPLRHLRARARREAPNHPFSTTKDPDHDNADNRIAAPQRSRP